MHASRPAWPGGARPAMIPPLARRRRQPAAALVDSGLASGSQQARPPSPPHPFHERPRPPRVLGNHRAPHRSGRGAARRGIQVDLGDSRGGFLTVRPKGAGAGASAVYLGGSDANIPFYDGTSKASEIQVYFNGRVPSTPQEVGALSAVTAVIEESRRSRFDEAVRTENVSSRLRTGVIAEVGAGRPATEGTQSILMPASCTPSATLACQ